MLARPVVAAGLALGLGASGVAYAASLGPGTGHGSPVAGAANPDPSAVDAAVVGRADVMSRGRSRPAPQGSASPTATSTEAPRATEPPTPSPTTIARATARQQEDAVARAKEDPQAVARELMAERGWTSDRQYQCLVDLWVGESDWRWWAQNSVSGAYGIPQSLPASKMARFGSDYRTNPITQIEWGLWYIDLSYGTPCGALEFWQAQSPHWY